MNKLLNTVRDRFLITYLLIQLIKYLCRVTDSRNIWNLQP